MTRKVLPEVRGSRSHDCCPEGVDSIKWALWLLHGKQVSIGGEVFADEGREHRCDIGLNVGVCGGAGVRSWLLQMPSRFGPRFWSWLPALVGGSRWIRVVQPILMRWIIFGDMWR